MHVARSRQYATHEIHAIALQLLDALSYLHSQTPPFIVGVLTARCIAVTQNGDGTPLPIIWDLTARYDKSFDIVECLKRSDPTWKSLLYFHPDILSPFRNYNSFKLGAACHDMWSLGCIVLGIFSQMRTELSDFVDKDGIGFTKNVSRAAFIDAMVAGGRPKIPDDLPEPLKNFCDRCFDRSTAANHHLVKHLRAFLLVERDVGEKNGTTLKNSLVRKQNFSFEWSNGNSFSLEWVSRLGEGSYGIVYGIKVIDCNVNTSSFLSSGNVLALKILSLAKLAEENRSVLLKLQHVHVLRYFAVGHVPVSPDGFSPKQPLTGILTEVCEGERYPWTFFEPFETLKTHQNNYCVPSRTKKRSDWLW